jgi:tetratricopeptide (TPR) repeat protein
LLGLNRFERAVEDFSFAINKADIDEAYYGRGLARGRIQQHDAAISDLDIYIIRHPQSSIAFTKRGIRKLWNDDREAARADFLKAIQLDENNAEAHDDLGVIYAQEGKYDLAIRQFKNTIRIDPTFHKAYHNLAMVYYLTDQNLLALANVNQGIAIAPGARNTLLLKAEILTALGEAEYARQLTEEAQNMQSGDWSERAPVE